MELQIVWRNPHPVRHVHRWESLEKAAEMSVYVVKEYVLEGSEGDGYWATECELQVLRGGRAA